MRILLISFLIGCSFCLSTRTTTAKKIEDLKSTKFGRTVLNLITLHSGVNGPINELIEAIDELVNCSFNRSMIYQTNWRNWTSHSSKELTSITHISFFRNRVLGMQSKTLLESRMLLIIY